MPLRGSLTAAGSLSTDTFVEGITLRGSFTTSFSDVDLLALQVLDFLRFGCTIDATLCVVVVDAAFLLPSKGRVRTRVVVRAAASMQ